MIPDEAELFTADEVIELELHDAIKRRKTEFVGRYKCTKTDRLNLNSKRLFSPINTAICV